MRRGIPCVTVERAAFDAMRTALDLREAVVAMDMVAAAELTSVLRMRHYVQGRSGWAGVGQVRAALDLASEHSRSPNETRLRLVWVLDAGLPIPEVNRPVLDRGGRLLGVADLLDVAAGVVGEYDGADHRAARRHTRDVAKEDALREHGLEVFRVTALDLPDRPGGLTHATQPLAGTLPCPRTPLLVDPRRPVGGAGPDAGRGARGSASGARSVPIRSDPAGLGDLRRPADHSEPGDSVESGRVDLDPGVPGAGDDPAVGVVQGAGGERLAAVAAEVPADHDVRLADDGQGVDAGGHPAEHAGPALEVLGPAADAVERGPGDGHPAALPAVDQAWLGVPGCGTHSDATWPRSPPTGPGKIRRPSPSARSVPQAKQVGNGWLPSPG